MSEVTKEDVKNAALKIAKETGSNDVSYASLQKGLDKLALGKLDGLVKELLDAEPEFGELDDKGTAKKSDDELILKIKGKAPAEAPKEEAAMEEKPKESAVDKEKKKTEKKAKKEVATKKAGAKKDAKAKGKEAQKGIFARIKALFGR